MLLLGASGCGKTTVLSVLAAILTPTAGRVRFDDIDVTGLRGAPLNRYRQHTVGIVFQAFNLVPSLTARENIRSPCPPRECRSGLHASAPGPCWPRSACPNGRRHRPGDLSGGQQQRVAIARALANDPPLVLADEPTAHLDYIQVDGVLRLLRQIADAGRLVVVATHDDRMLPLADRVVNLTHPATTPSHAHLRPSPWSLARCSSTTATPASWSTSSSMARRHRAPPGRPRPVAHHRGRQRVLR